MTIMCVIALSLKPRIQASITQHGEGAVIQWSALIREARHQWYISGDGDERARYGGGRDWCVRRTSLKRTARKALDRWIGAMVGKVFAREGAMRLLAT